METFVPEDTCSPQPTEKVLIPKGSINGRRVNEPVSRLTQLLNTEGQITRLVHTGGGNFTFHCANNNVFNLADGRFDAMTTFHAYQCLKDIAWIGEIVFRLVESSRR